MLQRLAVLVCAAAFTVACGQTDAGITTAVKTKLAADDTVKAYQIDVDTRDHVVTLTGEVQTSVAKDQALKLARETDGVRDVVDQLKVAETAPTTGMIERGGEAAGTAGGIMTDAAITSAVKSKLLGDTSVGGLNINVDTNDGVVTLSGRVSTQAEADQAAKLARETQGVKNVVTKLRISSQ